VQISRLQPILQINNSFILSYFRTFYITDHDGDIVSNNFGKMQADDEVDEYDKFDALALDVMQANSVVLDAERTEAKRTFDETPPVSFRFDVCSSSVATVREQYGSICSLDMQDVLKKAWGRQHGEGELLSKNCYIQTIYLEDSTNTFPVAMKLSCRQSDRISGSFARGKQSGDSANHTNEHNLWVSHTGDNFAYAGDGRNIYAAQDFVEGTTFQAYSKMLDSDFEDHTTKIQGGKAVEYLSPLAVIRKNDVVRGDCFIDVMYKNSRAFQHRVTALQTPISSGSADESTDDDSYSFSLRMHHDDWSELKSAVQRSVIQPLRMHVLDLTCTDPFDFILTPDAPVSKKQGKDVDDNLFAPSASGAENWRSPLLALPDGVSNDDRRVSCKLRFEVRFL
jgi:hypothetical protein